MSEQRGERLSLREKVAYGVGDLAAGLAVAATAFWFLYYMTEVAGISAAMAGTALMIGRLWDAVTDPVMGWVCDHTRSRWGKRRPYLLFGALPFALSFVALWVVPEFATEESRFWYVVIALVVFNTALTVVFIPYTSLTAAMTADYHERTSLTAFRMSASLAASLIGGALPPLLVAWIISAEGQSFMHGLGVQEIFGSWAGTRRQGYLLFAGLFGVIMVAALITTFLGTRERYVTTDREPGLREEGPLRYVMQLVALTTSSTAYRLSLLIKLFSTCAVTLIGVQLAYYIQFVLEMAADKPTIMGTLFCAAIISTPLWVMFTKGRGKITAYRWAAGGYIAVLGALLPLGTGPTNLIYGIAVLAGICHAGVLIIPWTIIPDVVEFDEFESGRRREGLLYGGTTFAYKFASGLALFIAGWVLSLVGYVPDSTQTPEAVTGILMSVVAGPALLLALSLIFTRSFPITPERHAEVVAALSARKQPA